MEDLRDLQPHALAGAVQRAIQVNVASQVSAFLALYVPSQAERVLLTVGASVLAVDLRASATVWAETASVAGDLTLAIAASTVVNVLAAPGPDSLPLTLAHLCVFLMCGEMLAHRALGGLAASFLSNAQYLFANVVTAQLLAVGVPLFAFVSAAGMAMLASWSYWAECLLAHSFALAGVGVFKAMLLNAIPPALQLQSVVALLCFARPLYAQKGFGAVIYDFALYQAADALQAILEALMPAYTACLAAAALVLVAPTRAYGAMAQIAAVGCLTDAVLAAIQQAAATDPFLALVTVLVGVRVGMAAVKSQAGQAR